MRQLHCSRDAKDEPGDGGGGRQSRIDDLHREAQAMRDFLTRQRPPCNAKGQELKPSVTDNDSAKMATGKGLIQSYAAQAAVDASHQVIVGAVVIGSASEQAMLLRMIRKPRSCR